MNPSKKKATESLSRRNSFAGMVSLFRKQSDREEDNSDPHLQQVIDDNITCKELFLVSAHAYAISRFYSRSTVFSHQIYLTIFKSKFSPSLLIT